MILSMIIRGFFRISIEIVMPTLVEIKVLVERKSIQEDSGIIRIMIITGLGIMNLIRTDAGILMEFVEMIDTVEMMIDTVEIIIRVVVMNIGVGRIMISTAPEIMIGVIQIGEKIIVAEIGVSIETKVNKLKL